MNIAVTGATGFVGRNLMEALLSGDHQLSVLCHRAKPVATWGEKVRIIKGGIEDSSCLENLFSSADLVFHLVGLIAETRSQSFDATVAEGTRKVVAAAVKSGVRRFLYVSALGTSAEAVSKYHKTKFLAEQAIRESGLKYTIFRPSVIIGAGDGFLAMLEKLIRWSPATPVIGSGRFKLQPIYMGDLVKALLAAIQREESVNQVINVAGPEELEYLDILSRLKQFMGKRRLNIFVPINVMKLIAGLLELVIKPAPITRDQLVMMETGNTGDTSSMKNLLGVLPITFEEALMKTYRKSGELNE